MLKLNDNLITTVHKNIGNCIRLKHLNLNGNRIGEIPREIGNCTLLEVFQCQNNFIETLPPTFGNIVALRVLELQNNKLSFLPAEIAKIPTIQEIHCDGNPSLTMVPDDMRATSDMVIWALRFHRDHQVRVEEKVANYNVLEEETRELVETNLRLRDKSSNLSEEIKVLEETRPTNYINFKVKAKRMSAQIKSKCTVS